MHRRGRGGRGKVRSIRVGKRGEWTATNFSFVLYSLSVVASCSSMSAISDTISSCPSSAPSKGRSRPEGTQGQIQQATEAASEVEQRLTGLGVVRVERSELLDVLGEVRGRLEERDKRARAEGLRCRCEVLEAALDVLERLGGSSKSQLVRH